MSTFVLAIDQGTTSTRAMLFRPDLSVAGIAQAEIAQAYPASGWVEHDPEGIWASVLTTVRAVLARTDVPATSIAALGITNQRETTVIWDRVTGAPIHPALVWQDRRTAEHCLRLKAEGHEPLVTARTGLILDPYFSATKIAWLLDAVPGARGRAERGELAFGTIDSWLLWRLTGGLHATDATNAARTALFDIHRGVWDDDLLALFGIPRALLPEVRDCAGEFGITRPELFGAAIPIRGVAGDQQAATIGQACFSPGMVKATYGTGCFALLNTGAQAHASCNRLLTTIAYQFGGQRTYALEGSIFVAGAAVQWLRDGLGLIRDAADSGPLAARSDPASGVYLVPAFVGLGAPHWEPDIRGALFGLARDTGPADFARAALESVCYQTHDLLAAMRADWPGADAETVLRADGGMAASDWTMQRLADLLGLCVDRPLVQETTALGAAYLAGWSVGFYPEPIEFAQAWRLERRFSPRMAAADRAVRLDGWHRAVRALRGMRAPLDPADRSTP
ncbi:Glycerol kinase [Methylobacterium adhaesivum]|uniref:Glycerol kinase n=1 Tax=Methylobacterium adhaesivum TaxID=333297 RepID=A0ABT8BEF3_9HYPH|nr:glycerol kinase GlpK [Methylobacterium adhaesivum]MDN3590493.1 glycerol kinase GlpK [Methylobacterium adhaesivum]GJD31315.1 Glycerol kinase [Methylobacterium adhaesivum]